MYPSGTSGDLLERMRPLLVLLDAGQQLALGELAHRAPHQPLLGREVELRDPLAGAAAHAR
jgi:hypothetical protein